MAGTLKTRGQVRVRDPSVWCAQLTKAATEGLFAGRVAEQAASAAASPAVAAGDDMEVCTTPPMSRGTKGPAPPLPPVWLLLLGVGLPRLSTPKRPAAHPPKSPWTHHHAPVERAACRKALISRATYGAISHRRSCRPIPVYMPAYTNALCIPVNAAAIYVSMIRRHIEAALASGEDMREAFQ